MAPEALGGQQTYSNVSNMTEESLDHAQYSNEAVAITATDLSTEVSYPVDDASSDYYSEIDKVEDLSCDLQNAPYANISERALPVEAPPPLPSVGPNESPLKTVPNHDMAHTFAQLSIDTKPAAQKLDPAFLAELEKHLGEKEASKNTNQTKDSFGIPAIRPPPASAKHKSPQGKVENSWQAKSTNVSRSASHSGAVLENMTDAIVNQMWQQQHGNMLLQIAPPNSNSGQQSGVSQQGTTTAATRVGFSNGGATSRPLSSASGAVLSEQVYAELKQTVPNLEQLSQNEFNTLYNKTVQQNILRSQQSGNSFTVGGHGDAVLSSPQKVVAGSTNSFFVDQAYEKYWDHEFR